MPDLTQPNLLTCRPSTPVPSTPVKTVAAALWQSQQARDVTARRATMASYHPLGMDPRDSTERLAAGECTMAWAPEGIRQYEGTNVD